MGRWFPDRRKGNREQVAAFDKAQAAQLRNAEQEKRAGIREETARYHELNHRDMRTTAAELRERRAERKVKRAIRAR